MEPCDACRTATRVSKVAVSENGRSAVFLNPNREHFFRTQIDGCCLKHQTACDWAVSKAGVGDVLIELKGGDVDRAIEQLKATVSKWRGCAYVQGKLAALIVASRYPRVDTKLQRAQNEFAQKFKIPLHLTTKNIEYKIERVFDFEGPL